MASLNIVVLYDRWEEPEEDATHADKSPLTRTLDKKEVEDEVAEALSRLGHHPTLHCLDGSIKSLHALPRMECDLVFNLAESFAGNDTADYCIAAYLELVEQALHGLGLPRPALRPGESQRQEIFEFHGIHTPVFARSFRGRLDFSHDLEFPGHREARTRRRINRHRVQRRRQFDSRADGTHRLAPCQFRLAGSDRGVHRGTRAVRGRSRKRHADPLPVVELDLSKLPEGTPRIAGAEVKWGQGTRAYRDTKSAIAEGLPDETVATLQQTALAVFQALELRDYARIDMRLRPDGRVAVIEANPNPWLASKAEFAMAARKAGRTYSQLIGEIIELASARYGGL